MTNQEKKLVAEAIVLTAQYYSRPLTPELVSLMVDDLQDLSAPAILEAFRVYRRNPESRFFPLPAQIRAIAAPQLDQESEAKEVAAKIIAAISKYGWNNPEKAKTSIGALGWSIINLQGGWTVVCETLTSFNIGQMQAQWRDLGLSLLKRGAVEQSEGRLELLASHPMRALTESVSRSMD